MILEFARIERFKTLLNAEVDLGLLNVFSGLNGMGKSSFIQALLLLRQSHELNALYNKGLILNGSYAALGVGTDVLSSDAQEESISMTLQWESGEKLDFWNH